MYYTKNSDPNYFNAHAGESNCGSFAFNVQGWYDPEWLLEEEVGDIGGWICDLFEQDGMTEEEVSDSYGNYIAEAVLRDFANEVHYLAPGREPESGEELIALRVFCTYNDFLPNWDFHFKVLRDGVWMEKCGRDFARVCDEDDWDYEYYGYISQEFRFTRKIS